MVGVVVDMLGDIDAVLVVGELDAVGSPMAFAPRKPLRLQCGTCLTTWMSLCLVAVTWRKIALEL